jgi:hypothetical protein
MLPLELYELRPTTLELVIALRENNTIGSRNYIRGNGKTTALMIHAKELMDNAKKGELVVMAGHNISFLSYTWDNLFGRSVTTPIFTTEPLRGFPRSTYLLLDEPYGLKWTDHDFRAMSRFNVKSVGCHF